MAIAKIEGGVITQVEPFIDVPPDETWLYINQASPNFDQYYYTFVDQHYVYDANNHSVQEVLNIVPKPIDVVLSQKLAALALYRWQQQNAGTIFNGIPILTDDDAQSKILGARVAALVDPTYTVNWKTSLGFFQLDATTIAAISDAVRIHIQSCFDNEMAHTTALQALNTAQAVIDYDFTTGWPT